MSRLESLPRYPLATLPTPLDHAPRLSKELGVDILFKRDDLTGFALGGNKARKLEFLIADALSRGANTIVTGGGTQSNHARMTAAAARKAGMDATLVLFGEEPEEVNGNLLLDQLLGATLVYAHSNDREVTERLIDKVTQDLRAQGKKPYSIPLGGSTVLGCSAYILAMGELLAQLQEQNHTPDYIFITTGSCGTHAGILAGSKWHGASIPVRGISVGRSRAECEERIGRLVVKTGEFLDHPLTVNSKEILVDDGYIGPGYGKPTPECVRAIRTVARLEGIFLDPVYTGKTMAALMDLIRRGDIPRGSRIVFWHTGGMPGLFGVAGELGI